MRAHRRSTRGITTAELLVGTSLSLFAVSAMYSSFRMQTAAISIQDACSRSQAVTRTLIDLMSRELRMAGYDPSGLAVPQTTGSCPGVDSAIMGARPDFLQFRQDLNGDGDLNDPGEVLTYDFVEGQVRRREGDGTPVAIASGLPAGGIRFRYYDGNRPPAELVPAGSPAALTQGQRNCVAKVRITAHAQVANVGVSSGDTQPIDTMADSSIAIRNLSLANF